MSRRTRPCRTCAGRTRHDDRCCSRCRRRRRMVGKISLRLVTPKDPAAPTRADLDAGVDITGYLA